MVEAGTKQNAAKSSDGHVKMLSFRENNYGGVIEAFNLLVDITGLGAHTIMARIAPMITEDPERFIKFCRSNGVKIG